MEAFPISVKNHLLSKTENNIKECDLSGVANPLLPYNVTDVVNCGLPMRRLKFGGISERIIFVFYEHGGRGHHFHLVIYRANDIDTTVLFAGRFGQDPTTIPELKKVLNSGNIENEVLVADTNGYW